MKKAMLFFAAFLFFSSANAATITLSNPAGFGSSISIGQNNQSTVSLYGSTFDYNYELPIGTHISEPAWISFFHLNSNTSVLAEFSFSFSTTIIDAYFENNIYEHGSLFLNITDSFSALLFLEAGKSYFMAISQHSQYPTTPIQYSLTISQVPLPVSLFLFAPALFGFMGLRHRAKKKLA